MEQFLLNVNGKNIEVNVDPNTPILWVLRDHLNLVFIGHVDAGKSTTTGHLIFKLGGVSQREMEKLQEEAANNNMSSFAFAYYMKFFHELITPPLSVLLCLFLC